MKKKITLFWVITALCVSGGVGLCESDPQVGTPGSSEVRLSGTDVKAEIKATKAEIRQIGSNVSSAKRTLKKARKSESAQRELCNKLEEKLSAKRAVYKQAEARIAAGNNRAAKGQASLAAEINALETEYSAAVERWEMDKLAAKDSTTVIGINEGLIAQKQKRIRDLESGAAQAEPISPAPKLTVAPAKTGPAAPVAKVPEASSKDRDAELKAKQEAKAAAEAAKAAEERAKADKATAELKAKQEAKAAAEAAKVAEQKAKADKAAAELKAKQKAKAAAEAAKAEKKAAAAAEKQKRDEAIALAEKEAKARKQAKASQPLIAQEPAPEVPAAPADLDPTSREAKLHELLELYRQDKITPHEYYKRQAEIYKESK